MKEVIIQKNDSDQRLDKFLLKTFPNLPKSFMYKSIRNKKIKVNRKRCEISTRLQEGDSILLFIHEDMLIQEVNTSFLQAERSLDIVYEDERLLVVNKPSGLLVHEDIHQKDNTLIDRALAYLYDKKEYDPYKSQSFTPAFAHRIDRNTEGLLLLAKDAGMLRYLNEIIKEKKLQKYYLALVEGDCNIRKEHLAYHYKKDEKNNQAILSDTAFDGSTLVEINVDTKDHSARQSLVEVELLTGKSHQIRAILSRVGYPLVGDVKYGAHHTSKKTYQQLCAYRIVFPSIDEEAFAAYSQMEFEITPSFR